MDNSKAEKRKARQKIYYVLFTILSLGILISGFICLNSLVHSGSERVIDKEESLIAAVRDTSNTALTDDEFVAGVDKIIPKDYTTDSDYYNAIGNIKSAIKNELELECEITRRNYFGECAICLKISSGVDTVKLNTVLQTEPVVSRVYVQLLDSNGTCSEYVFAGGEVAVEYDFAAVLNLLENEGSQVSSNDAELAGVWDNLVEEYQLEGSRLFLTGADVIVGLDWQANTADIISLFDYLYVWMHSSDKNYNLIVCRGSELCAYARPQDDREMFEKYYPSQELAGYYRLAFYNANNYFKNSLYDSSLLYYAP